MMLSRMLCWLSCDVSSVGMLTRMLCWSRCYVVMACYLPTLVSSYAMLAQMLCCLSLVFYLGWLGEQRSLGFKSGWWYLPKVGSVGT